MSGAAGRRGEINNKSFAQTHKNEGHKWKIEILFGQKADDIY